MTATVHVIGGGLAGSEAAWQLARGRVPVILHEMRPVRETEAHKTGTLAELVCSNSFRSDDWLHNAVGLLHEEMRRCGSLILRAGDAHKLPAGSALAVDRDGFADAVQAALEAEPLVEIRREAVPALPDASWGQVIVATGPLTSVELAQSIRGVTGEDALAFFDAIAPIVYRDTVDFEIAWLQSRYDKPGPGGTGADYVNCPLDEAQYRAFVDAVLAGDKHAFKAWESSTPYFEGCLPIEVMAERGLDTLRFGPMKPVGLIDPRTGRRPFAVVQLRQDNALGTLFNMVGFQTKLTWGEQKRIFRMIPGPGTRRVRPPRRRAPQHLHQQSAPAGSRAASEGDAAHPLRRPDHRSRRLRGKRGDRPSGRPLRGVRDPRRADRGAARDHCARRAPRAHYEGRRCCDVSTDEHQFRAVPAA